MYRVVLSALVVGLALAACGGGSAPFEKWSSSQAIEASKAAIHITALGGQSNHEKALTAFSHR